MEYLVIVFYAAILGLVAPYLHAKSDEYGVLLAPAIAFITGSIFWAGLTWLGFKYSDAYIWLIVMLLMPAAMVVISSRIGHARQRAREEKLRG